MNEIITLCGDNCTECFPCAKINDMLERSRGYQQHCKEVCTKEEYVMLKKAFFDKENNLKKQRGERDYDN